MRFLALTVFVLSLGQTVGAEEAKVSLLSNCSNFSLIKKSEGETVQVGNRQRKKASQKLFAENSGVNFEFIKEPGNTRGTRTYRADINDHTVVYLIETLASTANGVTKSYVTYSIINGQKSEITSCDL